MPCVRETEHAVHRHRSVVFQTDSCQEPAKIIIPFRPGLSGELHVKGAKHPQKKARAPSVILLAKPKRKKKKKFSVLVFAL